MSRGNRGKGHHHSVSWLLCCYTCVFIWNNRHVLGMELEMRSRIMVSLWLTKERYKLLTCPICMLRAMFSIWDGIQAHSGRIACRTHTFHTSKIAQYLGDSKI